MNSSNQIPDHRVARRRNGAVGAALVIALGAVVWVATGGNSTGSHFEPTAENKQKYVTATHLRLKYEGNPYDFPNSDLVTAGIAWCRREGWKPVYEALYGGPFTPPADPDRGIAQGIVTSNADTFLCPVTSTSSPFGSVDTTSTTVSPVMNQPVPPPTTAPNGGPPCAEAAVRTAGKPGYDPGTRELDASAVVVTVRCSDDWAAVVLDDGAAGRSVDFLNVVAGSWSGNTHAYLPDHPGDADIENAIAHGAPAKLVREVAVLAR